MVWVVKIADYRNCEVSVCRIWFKVLGPKCLDVDACNFYDVFEVYNWIWFIVLVRWVVTGDCLWT